jgi:hypothetical protein
MSRPKPRILAEQTDRNTYRTEQVLAATGIYAVFYDDQPINLKTANLLEIGRASCRERVCRLV